jgi:hypothetical protein
MINNIKDKQGGFASTQGGFLKLIIFIIIALFLMKYLDISLSDVVNWVKALFNSVF